MLQGNSTHTHRLVEIRAADHYEPISAVWHMDPGARGYDQAHTCASKGEILPTEPYVECTLP